MSINVVARGFNYDLELNLFLSPSLHKYHLFITTIKPTRNWKQWLYKIWGGGEERNKGRYGLWDNGEYLWVYFITMQFTT